MSVEVLGSQGVPREDGAPGRLELDAARTPRGGSRHGAGAMRAS
jgi:hypothetical protein